MGNKLEKMLKNISEKIWGKYEKSGEKLKKLKKKLNQNLGKI